VARDTWIIMIKKRYLDNKMGGKQINKIIKKQMEREVSDHVVFLLCPVFPHLLRLSPRRRRR
jgi:ATP-dependent Clp protease ATP-binding subunit ClpA